MRSFVRPLAAWLGLVPALCGLPVQAAETGLRVDAQRIESRIRALSAFGRNADGGVDRVAFSDADKAGRDYVMGLMREAGLRVRIDSAGNIIGRRDGAGDGLPVIMFGSHIDSVPGGGNYDGDVGVIGALEVVQVLHDVQLGTQHPLEIVVFADEEGGTLGSKAMAGAVPEGVLAQVGHSGKSNRDGIRFIGGDPGRLRTARVEPGAIAAFIELHIEQGARLYEAGTDIGVVEGIVGIRWWDVVVEGEANHAGTTPMNRRRDALLGAAELTLAINRVALEMPGQQVATVGRIRAEPGAPNVIPGRVAMSLEVRDLSADRIDAVFAAIRREARGIAERRGTAIRFASAGVDLRPALSDARLRTLIADVAGSLGLSHLPMPSGAGHDAQEMAAIAPTGMIFVPSVGGISHAPREFTHPADMANGAAVLLHTVLRIDGGALQP